ncbi:hypothetical protein FACS189491_02710 [Spirochaetia bacterium]|nr:hypothetical protein FACS189491_02710 [Spirochaetia bacterium]
MPVYKLGDIAKIQTGLVLARRQASHASKYTYQRLLLRALRENGTINLRETESYVSSGPLDKSVLTQAGTIVIKLSAPLNPVLITEQNEGMVIPSQMAAIEIQDGILPEYIRVYLSRKSVADQLLANYVVIAQRGITINSLMNLGIEVPSLKNQRLICACYENVCKKHQLRNELDQQEQKMMNYIFLSLSKDKKESAL